MKKKILILLVLTILAWFPIIWANVNGYVPMAIIGITMFFIFIINAGISIAATIISIKYFINSRKEKGRINKFILVLMILNIIYIIFGYFLFWWYYAF